jgi:hypothetical protein
MDAAAQPPSTIVMPGETGCWTLETSDGPRMVWVDDRLVVWVGPPSENVGDTLVTRGGLTADELAAGMVTTPKGPYLARLIQLSPTVDPFRLRSSWELALFCALGDLERSEIITAAWAPEERHPGGLGQLAHHIGLAHVPLPSETAPGDPLPAPAGPRPAADTVGDAVVLESDVTASATPEPPRLFRRATDIDPSTLARLSEVTGRLHDADPWAPDEDAASSLIPVPTEVVPSGKPSWWRRIAGT